MTTNGTANDETPQIGSPASAGSLTLEGRMHFLNRFLPVRNDVINDFYHTPHDSSGAKKGTMQNLRAAIRLLGGGANDTVAQLYELYYNRLFSTIWLALNWGPYTDEIRQVADPLQRLYVAQISSVDTCWQPVVQSAPGGGLLVEIGTGLSDGWARVALMRPDVTIVSITIERDQAEIARRIAARLGLADRVEIRVGDVFDPATTRDLVGGADAVAAMGVIAHFPPPGKAEGLRRMAAMLKPGAPLLIFDGYTIRPFSRFMARALPNSLVWYPTREEFRSALDEAGLLLVRFDTHTAETCLPIADDTRSTNHLRQEVGTTIAWLFATIVRHFMKGLLKPMESVYLSCVRR